MIFRIFLLSVVLLVLPVAIPAHESNQGITDLLQRVSNVTLEENLPRLAPAPFIIDGEAAGKGDIPFQAALRSAINSTVSAFCGGSLIGSWWVLTAAHCLVNTINTRVLLGGIDWRTGMPYNETSYFRLVHKLYVAATLLNDIGLVRLPAAAKVNGTDIPTIAIAPTNIESLVGKEVQASGFGLTANTGNISNTLNKVKLFVVTNAACQKDYSILIVTGGTICAKYSTRLGQSTCNGDSGGPLVYTLNGTRLLVGITSFGSSAGCDSGKVAGFTRVSSQHNWIEDYSRKYENLTSVSILDPVLLV